MDKVIDFIKKSMIIIYILTIFVVAGATAGIMFLYHSISTHKEEEKQDIFRIVALDENTIDPVVWGKNYPRQYDSYKRTVDTYRTKHGGSEAIQKLDTDPKLRIIFNGYAFAVDYREERGHAYMLSDQDMTERVKVKKQPGACLHCHASIIPAYYNQGVKSGISGDKEHRQDAIMKGFELVCAMPYEEGRKLVEHPVTCLDCHDPETMGLRVTRPGFINGIKELAKSDYPLPHLQSIEIWRKNGRKGDYDVNAMATRQEMRSFVCGQCHVEYYFKGDGKLLTYPWSKGLKAEQIETYYDEAGFKDWEHKQSGAPVLKAQHPEFEVWNQGVHAKSGVACADCHMPYKREGAIKVSDHHVRSPLINISNSCQVCHHYSNNELMDRAQSIQDKTRGLMDRAENSVVELIKVIEVSEKAGTPPAKLEKAKDFQRKAQWRLDFVAAENSMGFHAPQETARILGEAIDYARQGQIEVLKIK